MRYVLLLLLLPTASNAQVFESLRFLFANRNNLPLVIESIEAVGYHEVEGTLYRQVFVRDSETFTLTFDDTSLVEIEYRTKDTTGVSQYRNRQWYLIPHEGRTAGFDQFACTGTEDIYAVWLSRRKRYVSFAIAKSYRYDPETEALVAPFVGREALRPRSEWGREDMVKRFARRKRMIRQFLFDAE